MSADGQRGWEGLHSLRNLYPLKNVCEYVRHLRKIGDCEEGRRHLSPRVSVLGVSPVAGLPALVGGFTKCCVVPAEAVLGWLRSCGGGAVWASRP